MLDKGRWREEGSGLVSCGLRPYSFGRGVVATSVPSRSDNKKQFATHWALTTTNDNRQLPLSPPLPFPVILSLSCTLSECLSVYPIFVPAAVLSQMPPYGQMVQVVCGLRRRRRNKIILFIERFPSSSPGPIICDIRSSQWTGQPETVEGWYQTEILLLSVLCRAFCK